MKRQKTMASNATAVPQTVTTTKRGINLATFEDVLLVKQIPVIPQVASIEDALARLDNDHAELLKILQSGLQSKAVEFARESNDGWLETDEEGNPTQKVFSGTLANSEDVNPVVLMFAKLNFGYDEATTPEEKRAAKKAAKEMIAGMPKVLEGLQKKAAASQKSASE